MRDEGGALRIDAGGQAFLAPALRTRRQRTRRDRRTDGGATRLEILPPRRGALGGASHPRHDTSSLPVRGATGVSVVGTRRGEPLGGPVRCALPAPRCALLRLGRRLAPPGPWPRRATPPAGSTASQDRSRHRHLLRGAGTGREPLRRDGCRLRLAHAPRSIHVGPATLASRSLGAGVDGRSHDDTPPAPRLPGRRPSGTPGFRRGAGAPSSCSSDLGRAQRAFRRRGAGGTKRPARGGRSGVGPRGGGCLSAWIVLCAGEASRAPGAR